MTTKAVNVAVKKLSHGRTPSKQENREKPSDFRPVVKWEYGTPWAENGGFFPVEYSHNAKNAEKIRDFLTLLRHKPLPNKDRTLPWTVASKAGHRLEEELQVLLRPIVSKKGKLLQTLD